MDDKLPKWKVEEDYGDDIERLAQAIHIRSNATREVAYEAARIAFDFGCRMSAQAPGMEAMPLPDPEHIWMAIRDCRRIVAEPGYLPTNIEYSNFLNMAGVLLDLASRKPLLIDREALVKACHEGMVNYVLEGPAGMARRIEAALQAAERVKA